MILSEYLGLTKQPESEQPWNYLFRPEAQGKAKSFEEAFALIQADPILLERPFVIDWDRKLAVLGRPDISRVEKLVAERVELANNKQ
jgi:arsenate reductase